MNLLDETRRLLQSRPRSMTLPMVAEGSGLTLAWLQKFSQNRMPDPSVVKVQRLHDFLAGQS